MTEKTKPRCCDTAEAFVKKFASFEYPVYIERSEGRMDLKSDRLAMRVFKRTPAGNVSKQTKVIFLSFCPFCGEEYG